MTDIDKLVTGFLTSHDSVYLRRKDTGRGCLLIDAVGATEWAASVSVGETGVVFEIVDGAGASLWEGSL